MTRVLDERFLSVHPRTLLWWKQREQCLRCAHVVRTPSGANHRGHGGGPTLLHCSLVRIRRGQPTSCIDARDNACGADGVLFKPAATPPA